MLKQGVAVTPYGVSIGKPVVAVVRVVIAPDGTLAGGGIEHSTGNAALDGAAVYAVETSRFEPAIRDCKPVQATYVYLITFPVTRR